MFRAGAWLSTALNLGPSSATGCLGAVGYIIDLIETCYFMYKIRKTRCLSQRIVASIQLANTHTGPIQGLAACSQCSVNCPLLKPASLQPRVPPGPPPHAGACCHGILHAFQNILCASLLPLLGSENYPKFSSQTLHSLQMHSSHRLLLRAPQPFQMELLPPLSCAPLTRGLYLHDRIHCIPCPVVSIWLPPL